MPTTFIGRDNNNKPCYHVRKTDGLTASAMKAGVQDDTLFHSSLPYLQVLADVSVGKTSSLSKWFPSTNITKYGFNAYIDVFTIPSSISSHLQAGHMCLCVATYSDGSTGAIDLSTGLFSELHRFTGEVTTKSARVGTIPASDPYGGSSGWWALPLVPTTYDSSIASCSKTTATTKTTSNLTTTLTESTTSYLAADSISLCFQRHNGTITKPRDADYWFMPAVNAKAPIPTNVRFLVLNLTITGASMTFNGLGANGTDIKLSKAGFLINESNILAGKTFLSVDKADIGSGSSVTSTSFTGNLKLITSSIYPFSYPNARISHGALTSDTRVSSAGATAPLLLSNYSGVVVQQPNYCVLNMSALNWDLSSFLTTISAEYTKYNTDAFKLVTIPATSSCEVAADYLKINGSVVFNATTPLIYPATSGAVPIIVQTFTLSGATGDSTTVLATFNINKPANRFILCYHVNLFDSTNFSFYSSVTNSTNVINFGKRNYTPNLGAQLVTLAEGQSCRVLGCTSAYQISGNSETGGGALVLYTFKRVGSTVQLIRTVNVFNSTATTINVTIPGFQVNYIQLASAF